MRSPEDGLESGNSCTLEQGHNPVEVEAQIWVGEHQLPNSSSRRFEAEMSWALDLLKDLLRSTISPAFRSSKHAGAVIKGSEQEHHEGKLETLPQRRTA